METPLDIAGHGGWSVETGFFAGTTFSIYGALLTDVDHKASELVREDFLRLHNLLGEKIAFVTFESPSQLSAEYESYCREKLGSNFDEIWAKMQQPHDRGLAYTYAEKFGVKRSKLPCLVLFTDRNYTSAVRLKIPDWKVDELWKFFEWVVDTCSDCISRYPDPLKSDRLGCLETCLNSRSAKFSTEFKHLKRRATAYIQAHPALIVTTAIGFVAALATGNVIPLGASGLVIVNAAKDAAKELAKKE